MTEGFLLLLEPGFDAFQFGGRYALPAIRASSGESASSPLHALAIPAAVQYRRLPPSSSAVRASRSASSAATSAGGQAALGHGAAGAAGVRARSLRPAHLRLWSAAISALLRQHGQRQFAALRRSPPRTSRRFITWFDPAESRRSGDRALRAWHRSRQDWPLHRHDRAVGAIIILDLAFIERFEMVKAMSARRSWLQPRDACASGHGGTRAAPAAGSATSGCEPSWKFGTASAVPQARSESRFWHFVHHQQTAPPARGIVCKMRSIAPQARWP